MVKLARGISGFFLLATLGGCATMRDTGTQDCVERNGYQVNLLVASISKRSDRFSEECAAARAATVISTMKKRDGSPDFGMYNLAVSIYEQSNARIREFMDKMLKEEGTSVDAMKFAIAKEKGTLVCERATVTNPDGTVTTGFRCKTPAAPAAN